MKNEFELKPVKLHDHIEQCWEVALLLRPHLNKEKWLTTILGMMETEKYKIAGIFDKGNVVAFAGYREMTSLHSGNIIYIDDLCTLESYRSNGLATKLLDFVNSIAVADNKDAVIIDTGFSNATAHKLYLNHGFKLLAFHLAYHVKL
jgi:GNAT superfamily N-acetyltransferase